MHDIRFLLITVIIIHATIIASIISVPLLKHLKNNCIYFYFLLLFLTTGIEML